MAFFAERYRTLLTTIRNAQTKIEKQILQLLNQSFAHRAATGDLEFKKLKASISCVWPPIANPKTEARPQLYSMGCLALSLSLSLSLYKYKYEYTYIYIYIDR